jgi:hypothetical protein
MHDVSVLAMRSLVEAGEPSGESLTRQTEWRRGRDSNKCAGSTPATWPTVPQGSCAPTHSRAGIARPHRRSGYRKQRTPGRRISANGNNTEVNQTAAPHLRESPIGRDAHVPFGVIGTDPSRSPNRLDPRPPVTMTKHSASTPKPRQANGFPRHAIGGPADCSDIRGSSPCSCSKRARPLRSGPRRSDHLTVSST